MAAAALGEASDTTMAHPLALQLRNLQTLVELGVEKNTTIVFPAPLMSAIGELGAFLARESAAAAPLTPTGHHRGWGRHVNATRAAAPERPGSRTRDEGRWNPTAKSRKKLRRNVPLNVASGKNHALLSAPFASEVGGIAERARVHELILSHYLPAEPDAITKRKE